MAKKENNKNKAKTFSCWAYGGNQSEDKNTKMSKDEKKQLKKSKSISLSLDKKDARKLEKFMSSAPKVPKDIRELRAKCNHVGEPLTVDEFNSKYTNKSPLLDLYLENFAKDSIRICETCGEPLLCLDELDDTNIKASVAVICGAITFVTANLKMSKSELEAHAEMKDVLLDYLGTILVEMHEAESRITAMKKSDDARSANKTYKSDIMNGGSNGRQDFVRES